MKILFSPSEAKFKDGENKSFDKDSFIFPELFDKRLEIINMYQDYINDASKEKLEKIFGTKKEDVISYYNDDIFKRPTKKVIERYDGVAFDYLKYEQLKDDEKKYIDENVMIFSNLFGPMLCGDNGLPDYKLKQSENINGFKIENFYKENFTESLNEYLENEDIIDLRAGFYEKFYKINKPYTTMKFIKDGKVVSHWAKAYRGVILNEMAKKNIQTIEEFLNMEVASLKVEEIKEQKLKKEIVFSIIE